MCSITSMFEILGFLSGMELYASFQGSVFHELGSCFLYEPLGPKAGFLVSKPANCNGAGKGSLKLLNAYNSRLFPRV